jgi:alpha-ribazole phosphatase
LVAAIVRARVERGSAKNLSLRTVFLVRHGESASNAGGVTMPHALIPLTARGHQQAMDLGRMLPAAPTRVLASPFVRATDTAKPYANRTGRAIEPEPLLQEFDMIDPALIAGMDQAQRRPIADAFWQEADPDKRMGDKAETFRAFASRVSSFLANRLPTLPDQTVCFGHGIWIGMAAWQLLGFADVDGQAMRRFRRFQTGLPLPNGVVYRLVELAPGAWALRAAASVKAL